MCCFGINLGENRAITKQISFLKYFIIVIITMSFIFYFVLEVFGEKNAIVDRY